VTGENVIEVEVERMGEARSRRERDLLAVEEPLEIRLHHIRHGQPARTTVSVTMRTPGNDVELAAGFLFTEGIIRDRAQVAGIRHCGPLALVPGAARNVVRVDLAPGAMVDLARLERHFYTSSSCGVCGKTSIEALQTTASWSLPAATPVIDADRVHALPAALGEAQRVFAATGGLHASALFDVAGALLLVREDVGRHNALDKVIGAAFLAGRLPAHDRVLLVSGRASFELVQKAAMAGIPILAAVGAPSSLAVSLAQRVGMTLLGFVREGRFNTYCGAARVRHSERYQASGAAAVHS
jgi:FdhD protein